MKNKLSSLVGNQLPSHLKDNDQTFHLFLETYFKYIEERNGAVGLINYHPDNIDIDRTLDEFIDDFYKSYGEFIPKDTEYNRKDLLKKLSELQSIKGTTSAVKLLFRMLFNTSADVSYPKEQMLRASDGVWEQQFSFRVQITVGDLLADVDDYEAIAAGRDGVTNTFRVKTIKRLSGNIFDVFIVKRDFVQITDDSTVTFINESLGGMGAWGFLVKTPVRIDISNKGKRFRAGQVVRASGSVSPTVIRITKVDSEGGILDLEIIEAGSLYESDSSTLISPFSFVFEQNSRFFVDENGDLQRENFDRTNGFTEVISIDKNVVGFDPNGYFAESYVSQSYNSIPLLRQTISTVLPDKSNQPVFVGDITQEEYNESLAIVVVRVGNHTDYPGRYLSDSGKISNSNIKLQDSFFYQNYSYVIESPILISKYRSAYYRLAHPAGLKLFSKLNLEKTADNRSIVDVFIKRELLLAIDDSVTLNEDAFKSIETPKVDSLALDDDNDKSINSLKIETLISSDTTSFDIDSSREDSMMFEVEFAKDASKNLETDFLVTDEGVATGAQYTEDVEPYFAELYAEELGDDVEIILTPG